MTSCIASPYYGARADYVCACLSTQLAQDVSRAELTYAFPDYFVPSVKNGSDRYLTEVNARLVGLGYDAREEPVPPSLRLEAADFDGVYCCANQKVAMQLRASTVTRSWMDGASHAGSISRPITPKSIDTTQKPGPGSLPGA